ncbi:hypothetical protein D3H35_09250 [Cohnella faecalis]|uniref:Uncharacterized protein n=1 Tax=Cohnella faecalis TaxID=2315694 RepID=A0A398CWB9_9BACL|nr:hypothetical protein D3H35_09250 [Cohnella faecalis]
MKKLTAGKQQPVFDLPNAVPVELPAPIDASERERKQPNAIVNERTFRMRATMPCRSLRRLPVKARGERLRRLAGGQSLERTQEKGASGENRSA